MIKLLKQKIIPALTAIAMAVCLLPAGATAAEGAWENIKWSIAGNTLTVTGETIPDCTQSAKAPWSIFADKITTLTLDGVRIIGNRSFKDLSALTTVNWSSIESLGDMAFAGCTSLTEMNIPDSTTAIGAFAFANCTALKTVAIPQSLASLGEGFTEGCADLASFTSNSTAFTTTDGVLYSSAKLLRYPPAKEGGFTTPDTVTTVANGAFRDCTKLTKITLPQTSVIGDGAFYGCSALSEITAPSLRGIGRAAFYGCAVKSFTAPATLTAIGDSAFAFCESLSRIDFKGNAPTTGTGILEGCAPEFIVTAPANATGFGETWQGAPVMLHSIHSGTAGEIAWELDTESGTLSLTGDGPIPDFESPLDAPWYPYRKLILGIEMQGITAIGKNSFRYTKIENLTLPDSVKSIGSFAFYGCADLAEADLAAAESIGECAFFGCGSLTMVKTTSVTAIGSQAMADCASLKYIFTGMTAPTMGNLAFDMTEAVILYPTGADYPEYDGVTAEPYAPGDANGDGICNSSDASLLMKYIASWDVSVNKVSADTNCDGTLNMSDVSLMMKYIAGWDVQIGPPVARGGNYRHSFT